MIIEYNKKGRCTKRANRYGGKRLYMVTQVTEVTQASKHFNLDIIVRKKKNKTNGNIFTTYAAKQKDGKWIETRFTQDVPKSKVPTAYSKIVVSQDMMNIDKRGKYPKLWIKGVESVEPLEKPIEDLTQYFD